MDTLEEEEEYNWREVRLPSLIPVVPEPELERETAERRRGRDILLAVDHGPNSKHAFDWALIHFCRLADTIHLVHAVSNVKNELVYEFSQGLMEKLAVEAFEVAMVKTVARIVQGDAGKVICKEAEKLKPAAVIMGTRGRSLIQSVLQGSVSEHVFHNCKSARHYSSWERSWGNISGLNANYLGAAFSFSGCILIFFSFLRFVFML